MVCTLIEYGTRHHSCQNLLWTNEAQPSESTTNFDHVMRYTVFDKALWVFWPLWWTKPLSILFFITISKITKEIYVKSSVYTIRTWKWHVHALHYANEELLVVYIRVSFQELCKLARYADKIRKHVWEKSSGAYSLLIRVQTTINHISICFFTTISPSRKLSFFPELKKAFCNTLTQAAWHGLLLTMQN